MPRKIDPLYKKIANDISINIGMGIYKANTPLKHQSEYAKDYHTSIGTVKKAFALLKNNGLINTVKGHGTYAIAYENSPAVDSGSFRVDSKVELYTSSVNVISHGITHANRQVAKMLDIEPFSSCYGIQLTRLLNNQPIACQNIYIRYDKLPNCNFYLYDLSLTSLFSLYTQHLGKDGFVTEKSLHAIICPKHIQHILNIDSDIPILFIKSILKHGQDVIEYNESYERTDLRPHMYRKNLHPKA